MAATDTKGCKAVNLEPLCASCGMKLLLPKETVKYADQKNTINEALGVLMENGVYALAVFLLTCNCEAYGRHVLAGLVELLEDKNLMLMPSGSSRNVENKRHVELLDTIRSRVTTELPKLLLARKVLEETLTFARYHCKAMKRASGEEE